MTPSWQKCHRLFKGPKGGLDRVQFPPRSCWLSLHVASLFQLLFKAMLFTPVWAEHGNSPSVGWVALGGPCAVLALSAVGGTEPQGPLDG